MSPIKRKDFGQILMHSLRIRLAIALIISLTIISGCGNKSHPQTSNHKAEVDKPIQSVSFDYEQTLSGIRDIVAKQLGLDARVIEVDIPLSKQKNAADELDVIEIIMNVEDTFGVEIKDKEVSNPEGDLKDDVSVRKLADIVTKKKGK